MSAPQATTDTNDIPPGLCECPGAQSPARATSMAGEERRVGGEAYSRFGDGIRQRCHQRGWRPMLRV